MKKILKGILLFVGLVIVWYFFIKPSDYIIRFETQTFPGAINQTIKLWHQTHDTIGQVEQNGAELNTLYQTIRFGDSIHRYRWKIKPLTDSTSKVIVGIKDMEHSFANKVKIPFSDTDFEKRSRKTVLDLMENLKDHIDKFKVTVVGEEDLPTKYLAYVPLKVTQFQKAGGMMKNFTYLTQTLYESGVELDGPPMVVVTKWDRENDSIYYNFAQPIIRSDRLPMGTDIQYKRLFGKRTLKAEYNGNYITSDRAWYALLDYAENNNIPVEPLPIEVFYNNPHTGGDELSWKAEIYLPLKEDEEL
ncbi:MAG: AraC family transcriptional regulator [Allomuricauda sp.]|nr:MAG: AraC family transcriptional regulator [Allomuricauda sp.]